MTGDSVADRTRAFYEWDLRGRSWERFDYPVDLEPPLTDPRPARPEIVIDDGRKETWLSSLFGRGQGPPPAEVAEEEPDLPAPADAAPPYESIALAVPSELEITQRAAEAWLRSVEAARHPVSWELISSRGTVQPWLSGAALDTPLLAEALGATFPDVVRNQVDQPLGAVWGENRADYLVALELGLGNEFVVPLADLRDFKLDPLAQIVASLALVGDSGTAVLQVLFRQADSRWPDVIRRAVTTPSGQPFFADAPEITALAKEKVSSPLFAAAVRLAVSAPAEALAWDVVRGVAGGLAQLKSPGNELIPVSMERSDRVVQDILDRTTHRHGMLLSARELVGLVHLPSRSVQSPALARGSQATAPAPESTQGSGVLLGVNSHHCRTVEVRLTEEDRLRHCHVVGASGTGKSTLMVSMMLEDIEEGHGVAVLDPHGDLVDELLARIPAKRHDDVVLFDPSDSEFVVGWNILGAGSELERELLASDLAATFERLATSWGDQMTTVLSNAVLAFLNSTRGGTLLDLRRFFLDPAFRADFVETITDDYIADYWRQDFPLIAKRNPQAPILTRLNNFLRNRLVRDVVTLEEGLVDFRSVLDDSRIFLARLSQGAIGEQNASLLGSLLVSKIHQVTLSRQDTLAAERRPFFLYLDEFHELATPSMATMFSGVRKYGLALTVAHQDLYQLRSSLPAVERAVLANAHTRICFRVGDEDAKRLSDGFSSFDAAALTDLGVGEAIVRLGKRTADFNLKTFDIPKVDRSQAIALREHALARWGVRRPLTERREDRETTPAEPGAGRPKESPQAESHPVADESGRETPRLDKSLLDYLEHVAVSPFSTVRERNDALGLSASTGQRTKTWVLDEGLVNEVSINRGGRGQQFKLLELTTAGREALAEFGVTPAAGLGRGGVAHQWWVNAIAEWLKEQGLKPRIEDDSSGVRVDLSYRAGNRHVAVEVETSRGHIFENISKDLGAGFDSVVTLLDETLDLEEIDAKLRSDLEGQMRSVRLGLLPDFKKRLAIPSSARRLARGNENQEPGRSRRRRRSSPSSAEPQQAPYYVPEPGVLTTPAAAEYLGLSPATLDTMRSRGGGPVFSKLGRRVVYRREDLDSWVLERQQKSTSDS